MVNGLIGKKVGMTQLFDDSGRVVPVTVIEAGPCVIVQRKTAERDGYEAAQLGLVEKRPARKATKPRTGHCAKANVPPVRVLREFRLAADSDPKPGETITCEIFAAGQRVDVVGTSKGRGFQGVIKRHGFGGGRASHGSMFHRAPGSIGQSAFPARVFPGARMPGQMGHRRVTVKGLEVVQVDKERNLLLVRGAVPGARGSVLMIRHQHGTEKAESSNG
ncbi:MAG: 50S ribosomal protein L3 [Acidobacteriota bacterium]|nr:MAG: 50S ribosomal protein L3 [Acidobacteriota bacterium]